MHRCNARNADTGTKTSTGRRASRFSSSTGYEGDYQWNGRPTPSQSHRLPRTRKARKAILALAAAATAVALALAGWQPATEAIDALRINRLNDKIAKIYTEDYQNTANANTTPNAASMP